MYKYIVALALATLPAWGQINNPPTGGGGGNTCGAPTCTVSTTGGGNGVLALTGNTSGTATLTAPAVAGTSTNPIVTSNTLSVPVGTCLAGAQALTNGGGGGISFVGGTATVSQCASGGEVSRASAASLSLGTNPVLNWGTSFTANDIGLFREVAGVLGVSPGGSAADTGLLRSGNSCTVAADIALPVGTATTVCSFSLPALAKVWIVHCDLPWTITAGTGTNTMSVGVNYGQTPAATTNLDGKVINATATAATFAVTPFSATGATSIVTGPTYTPAATIETASLDGSISASATAGTFTVTMTAAGTTATAASKAGAYCRLE